MDEIVVKLLNPVVRSSCYFSPEFSYQLFIKAFAKLRVEATKSKSELQLPQPIYVVLSWRNFWPLVSYEYYLYMCVYIYCTYTALELALNRFMVELQMAYTKRNAMKRLPFAKYDHSCCGSMQARLSDLVPALVLALWVSPWRYNRPWLSHHHGFLPMFISTLLLACFRGIDDHPPLWRPSHMSRTNKHVALLYTHTK